MRKNETVFNVWKDTKCVVVGSTEHLGHSENTVERNWKEKGKRQKRMFLYHFQFKTTINLWGRRSF